MKISTRGRYAIRMMLDIAIHSEGEYISLRDVAQRQMVSMKYMEQIVSMLTKGGFLHSVRGPQGGYRLARAPEDYTLGEILRATEGTLAPVACLTVKPNPCLQADTCITLPFWEGLDKVVNDYVDGYTLAQLLDGGKALHTCGTDAHKSRTAGGDVAVQRDGGGDE